MSLVVFKQLVGGQYVAVNTRENLGILHITRVQSVVVDLLILLAAALHDVQIVATQFVEGIKDAHLAAMGPVGLITLVHILYVLYLVVANECERRLWLLVDFAMANNAGVIVRGLRAVTDFEYELQLAQTNSVLNSGVDTMFLTTSLRYAYLSSSTVKEVASYGGDISKFVPPFVEKLTFEKFGTVR